MSKTLQLRRYPTSQISTLTGAAGELFVDTTLNTISVQDGSTAGGHYLAPVPHTGNITLANTLTTIVDSFSTTQYSAVKYFIRSASTGITPTIQATELFLVTNGTTSNVTVIGQSYTTANCAFTSNVAGTTVNLLVQSTNPGNIFIANTNITFTTTSIL
jgi:hypothetical protein